MTRTQRVSRRALRYVQLQGSAAWTVVALVVATAHVAGADGPIRFRDVAREAGSGIDYRRSPSPRLATLEEILERGEMSLAGDLPRLPGKPYGAPGVAIFDFDRDGDLDLYVTDGPGAASSLYANQLLESGELRFVDVAERAGVAAVDHDSTGVCAGDLDNDGDPELVVLGALGPNRLFENRGDGTFADVTERAGVGGGELTATSCALGDVDGDGLLDLAVANAYDWRDSRGLLVPFEHNQPNLLFRNRGGLRFRDVSDASGFRRLAGLPPEHADGAGVSWAVAMVDYDLDGDVDVFVLDNRGSPPAPGGAQHGLIHLHRNDGAGRFTDVTVDAGLNLASAWLGVAFADFDCDRRLDLFATNAGDYPPSFHPPGVEIEPGVFSSRWLLAGPDGRFRDPGVGELVATVMGWGVSAFDADNDGDPDVAYHGGLYSGFFLDAGNAGVVLENLGCSARFRLAAGAFAGSVDHARRNVQGVAAGDLDRDGFVDLVSVSSFDLPASVPLTPNPTRFGSPFDDAAKWVVTHRPSEDRPGVLEGTGYRFAPGTLAVELNSAEGGESNRWVEVLLRGSAGVTPNGRANRDGVGAVVFLATPERPAAGMRPVVAGSSYGSQDALAAHFGLGGEERATVEVLWPGGHRNRLPEVRAGERLVFPEIGCDVRRRADDPEGYAACVGAELDALVAAGVLDEEGRRRFEAGALPDRAPENPAPEDETPQDGRSR